MNNTNMKIRIALSSRMIYNYQLADLLGVSEATLCRKLRYELPEEEQDRIVKLIEEKFGDPK